MGKHSPPSKGRHSRKPASNENKPSKTLIDRLPFAISTDDAAMDIYIKSAFAVGSLLCMGIISLIFKGKDYFDYLMLIPAVIAALPLLKQAVKSIQDGRIISDNLIAVLAGMAMLAGGRPCWGWLLMLLVLGLDMLKAFAGIRTEQLDERLRSRLPLKAYVLKDGEPGEIDAAELKKDNIVIVHNGETVPVDGRLISGQTEIDLSYLLGKRKLKALSAGDKVLAGSVNRGEDIKAEATCDYEESFISNQINAFLRRRSGDTSSQVKSGKVLGALRIIMGLAGLVCLFGSLLLSGDYRLWLLRGGIFLAASLVESAKNVYDPILSRTMFYLIDCGVYPENTSVIELLSKAKTFIFSKTGTLTSGSYVITDVYTEGISEEKLISIAAAAESFSKHPLAIALAEAAGEPEYEPEALMLIDEVAGRGIRTYVDGRQVCVGNGKHMEEHGIEYVQPFRNGIAVHVAIDGEYKGFIMFSDKVLSGAFDSLERLRLAGVENMVMLTGDVNSVARPIASSLNFNLAKTELTLDGKLSAMEYIMATKPAKSTVAFAGCYADEPKLFERTDMSICLRCMDGENKLHSGINILSDELELLSTAKAVSRRCFSIAHWCTNAAIIWKVLLVILIFAGSVPVPLAVMGEMLLKYAMTVIALIRTN